VAITAYVPETTKVGEMAAELLFQLVEGKKPATQPVMVPGRLVERGSVRRLALAESKQGA
jgi:DNA-binding LacI/PurR family transcriptional regulator